MVSHQKLINSSCGGDTPTFVEQAVIECRFAPDTVLGVGNMGANEMDKNVPSLLAVGMGSLIGKETDDKCCEENLGKCK